jgi:hypothetical protein
MQRFHFQPSCHGPKGHSERIEQVHQIGTHVQRVPWGIAEARVLVLGLVHGSPHIVPLLPICTAAGSRLLDTDTSALPGSNCRHPVFLHYLLSFLLCLLLLSLATIFSSWLVWRMKLP